MLVSTREITVTSVTECGPRWVYMKKKTTKIYKHIKESKTAFMTSFIPHNSYT